MVEFFNNIFNWFVINKDEIVLFFTSANFISFLTAIVCFVKQIRAQKQSNINSNNLFGTLNECIEQSKKTENIAETVTTICNVLDTVKTSCKELSDSFTNKIDVLEQKLNAVLDVQSIVYNNSIRDDVVRKNVSNILLTAKLCDESTKAELEEEIAKLKETIAKETENVNKTVEVVEDKVKKVTVPKKSVRRY